MKRKDLLLIGGVAFIAAIFSFVLSGIIFGSPKKNPITVPVVNKISSDFPAVQNDTKYNSFFNDKALDPTQLINIQGNNNPTPFQNANQ